MKRRLLSTALLLLAIIGLSAGNAFSQTVVKGKVVDAKNSDPLVGVNVTVKGTSSGTISDPNGNFSFSTNEALPFTLRISSVGYTSREIDVNESNAGDIMIRLTESTLMGQEVVVSASRFEESILESPVTIEKIDLLTIRQAPSLDYYDALANVKGVQVNQGSFNFPSINTRGFATIANTRFVQLMDGMDNAAPLLNFPTGNLVGIGELDIESMELLPGAASALYGPNAFNGILIMNSKNPFDYQGLSAQAKLGVMDSDAGGTHPMYTFGLRYAKAFNDKLAFKVNFQYSEATDWVGSDYRTDARRPDSEVDLSGTPNFDGLNLYGDETQVPIPLGGPLGTLDLRRTGFTEEDLIQDYVASSIKADGALHYKVTDKMEAIYNYRFGGGNSIYQGGEKYALRDFTQQFHKLELNADNFFVRGYTSITDAGNSYNLSALGAFMNERFSPTATEWAPTYAQTYVLARQGYVPGVPAGNEDAAHAAARSVADAGIPAPGSPEWMAVRDAVISDLFQGNPPGASFIDDSRMYHGEFNYNFKNEIDFIDLMVGGNFRRYSLFSNATVFNEAPEGGEAERITIDEYGLYTQASKRLADDKLKLTASLRYDKNENFEGLFTPRFSAVYSLDSEKKNNIRTSFQTGFRNPDTQAQFIFFPAGTGIILGGTEANAAQYGLHNGGAWTTQSYMQFQATGDESVLETANFDYIQPERLQSWEIGYKGLIQEKLMLDVNYYYSRYTNFISILNVRNKEATTHQGNPLPAGTAWNVYMNAPDILSSMGAGLGLAYALPKGYVLSGNYSWATFSLDEAELDDFQPAFNTPENRFSVNFANREVINNIGFSTSFRWQQEFLWQSTFGSGVIPSFGVVDAAVSYKLTSLKSILKLAATNIGGGQYRTNFGGPFVGNTYMVSLTFDELLK